MFSHFEVSTVDRHYIIEEIELSRQVKKLVHGDSTVRGRVKIPVLAGVSRI